MQLSRSFTNFFDSEKSSGVLLIICTAISLFTTNSPLGEHYLAFWRISWGGLTIVDWINDALMAVFFLRIGLELEREFYVGELSDTKNALLPIFAALGGVCIPALIHFILNHGTPTQAGIGIPIATDIAFALGALSLVGNRIPASLKVFLTALAVMDDLAAIVVIALFYTAKLSLAYLMGAVAVFGALVAFNRLRVISLVPYLLAGALMWFLMLKSGVHATIAGVLTAFAIPFTGKASDEASPSQALENSLHKPVAFVILPIFALANTCIVVGGDWFQDLLSPNGLGILCGLILGKPIGITLASFIVVALGICRLPLELSWKHIFGAGLLGGIGFTMSVFITNLAFAGQPGLTNASKMAILLASATAGTVGYLWLELAHRGRAPG